MKTKLWLPFLVTLLLTLVNLETFSQSTIKGTIIEKSSGETIIGAAILEKSTSNGCVTDFNGKFTLKSENNYPITLIIRFIGFTTQELIVKSANDKIKISSTVVDKSESTKIIKIESKITNQNDKLLLHGIGKVIVRND